MLYSILIYASEDVVEAMTAGEEEAHIAKHMQVREQLAAQGRLGPAVRLMPTRTARQLRTAGGPAGESSRESSGESSVVDGPFAETKEQLLGLYVIDCESADEALEVARSLPSVGTIFEIRPVKMYFPGGETSAPANVRERP